MGIMECSNGHVYDTELYASCPYCAGGGTAIQFDAWEADGGIGKTAAPQEGQSGTRQEALGKTVAPERFRKHMEAGRKTVAVFRKQYDLDPVVGWLVCVEGPEKGKDYRLGARINSIGRSEGSDVCIQGDPTISKENHARLAYDPRHNSFQLIPGASTNTIYLNDEPVYVPVRLSAYDVVELGSCKMLFLPLCGERFQWTAGEN